MRAALVFGSTYNFIRYFNVVNTDCKKDGFQELSGEEPWGSWDSGVHQCHLLGQDRHPDPEQDDRGQHVDEHEDDQLGDGED